MDSKNSLKAESIDRVAIFGYADAKEGEELFTSVVEVAKALAQAGYVVVDGGGPGVMLAASNGAKQGGGKVIGVTFYPKDALNFEGRDPKNEIDEEVITHSYVERTLRLLERGQTFVIFNGGTGTISEFGMAWGLARLYFGHHKPLILYGKFWPEIIETFKKNMKIREEEMRVFKYANSPQEVLNAIVEFEREIKQGIHKHIRIVGDVEGESSFTL
ncbi:hypothetical protein A3B45_04230 [Candidatus Daviesbacteria bacterium RIFCSPLOWO2_01_FULL_39_12]|uniref:Lysine decarboxylase n=1 Tax=Candidatus Daviesbacteria bacterium RIFCSPLOWO2_01_FULL_39_12 TaxID=1797785 RepID=A0A1F5KN94_9BACT|nr:MAG: hypothetical protein A3D79_00400 [Candidatus Daviesbacteria bacterium RIFCSPHIGHO2_02_FULL_39_8]OGE42386.1 MAG: hypothetical protein A3B45_04230 [Candidatus Daviesbacteria bacterium RIFCSPLOWO2_01_FULL_39_12]